MLKFMAEFVLNKGQRLTFDSSSPNGILLFREVSKVSAVPSLTPSPAHLQGGRALHCSARPPLVSLTMHGLWRGRQWVRPAVSWQVLVTYGSSVLQAEAGADPYGRKYKGIWICCQILARALGGNYVNFGVFELYGDPALKVGTRLTAAA